MLACEFEIISSFNLLFIAKSTLFECYLFVHLEQAFYGRWLKNSREKTQGFMKKTQGNFGAKLKGSEVLLKIFIKLTAAFITGNI